MPKNEEGEFELILGNKQLMSVFFLVVVLLGLCFLIGYVFGRNSAPVLNAETAAPLPAATSEPLVVSSPTKDKAPEPAKAEPEPAKPQPPPPVQTAPQQPAETAKATPPPTPPPAAKQPPPKAPETKSAPKETAKAVQAPSGSQPVPGRMYLQLSATTRDQADAMVDLLRSRNFSAMAAQIPENPSRFRVLVGPLDAGSEARTRSDLKAASFPGDEAIRRVF